MFKDKSADFCGNIHAPFNYSFICSVYGHPKETLSGLMDKAACLIPSKSVGIFIAGLMLCIPNTF